MDVEVHTATPPPENALEQSVLDTRVKGICVVEDKTGATVFRIGRTATPPMISCRWLRTADRAGHRPSDRINSTYGVVKTGWV